MIEQLKLFVENGGRIRENEEPKFGEPFYGEYMQQFLSLHYKPGDRVKLQEKIHNNESKTYEGIIIALDYSLSLLISGKKVHKDKRNKKDIRYIFIESIEMVEAGDGTFDISTVDPDYWESKNNRSKMDEDFNHRKTEHRKKVRLQNQKEFTQVYRDVDFDKSHVIRINDGCSMYWPFDYESISAEIFMVRDENKITSIPCKTGTPFPNKNHFHAYNCKVKDRYPDLYLYLPDNGFRYEDVSIVCVWTIHTTISGKETVVKVVNIHQIGEIKPIEDEYNMIFIDMHSNPLLAYGESLFTDSNQVSMLTHMMDKDMYSVLDIKEDVAIMIKTPENQQEADKYLIMANLAVNSFNMQEVLQRITCEQAEYFPNIEVFCTIDQEPKRYYSGSWYSCREKYPFKMLEK
ncbi:MAG: hypothetical protein UHN47_03465 [Lachnospiraceae bacterium]|nr:hypothetical protein [Lachnospiraceae bacterium]